MPYSLAISHTRSMWRLRTLPRCDWSNNTSWWPGPSLVRSRTCTGSGSPPPCPARRIVTGPPVVVMFANVSNFYHHSTSRSLTEKSDKGGESWLSWWERASSQQTPALTMAGLPRRIIKETQRLMQVHSIWTEIFFSFFNVEIFSPWCRSLCPVSRLSRTMGTPAISMLLLLDLRAPLSRVESSNWSSSCPRTTPCLLQR